MRRLLWMLPVLLVGCASSHLLPDGTYLYQFKAEQRSLFGTNTTVTRAARCSQDLTKLNDWTPEYAEAVKACTWAQSEFHDSASQGQGGQIVGGALQGIGIGVAGSLIGSSSQAGASATASSAASATASGSKGGH